MFKRFILQQLKRWKTSATRKPLVLRGARQVGKTTIIREFAKEFDRYIELNLENSKDKALFEQGLNIDELIQAIFFHYKEIRNPNNKTLIFIDEIQNSANAVEMLRYFYEKVSDIYVISAGSLLETLIDYHVSFPVGRVEYLFMYPVTFEEFLIAFGEEESLGVLRQVPIPKYAHEKLLKLFHQYTLIGGMPEVVQCYIESRDLVSLTPIYRNLLTAYSDDIEKYAKNENTRNIIRHVMRSAPFEAGKRIKFVGFGNSNYRSEQVKEAILTLEKAMVMKLAYPISAVLPPAMPQLKKAPKLFFLDIGFVNFVAGLQSYFFGLENLNNIYQGLITEQVVAQELRVLDLFNNGEIYFWVKEKKQSNAEIDFIVPFREHLIPIEVKSGKAGTIRSLHQFMGAVDHIYAVRLNANYLFVENVEMPNGKYFKLLNLPYYLTGQIQKYLDWFVNENKS
jgi:hypothetical protein